MRVPGIIASFVVAVAAWCRAWTTTVSAAAPYPQVGDVGDGIEQPPGIGKNCEIRRVENVTISADRLVANLVGPVKDGGPVQRIERHSLRLRAALFPLAILAVGCSTIECNNRVYYNTVHISAPAGVDVPQHSEVCIGKTCLRETGNNSDGSIDLIFQDELKATSVDVSFTILDGARTRTQLVLRPATVTHGGCFDQRVVGLIYDPVTMMVSSRN